MIAILLIFGMRNSFTLNLAPLTLCPVAEVSSGQSLDLSG
jgi:hypothetical protein